MRSLLTRARSILPKTITSRQYMHVIGKQESVASRQFVFELFTSKDDVRPVYLTGNFNQWRTNDAAYMMTSHGRGHYSYTLQAQSIGSITTLEYKFVKGGWDGEELEEDGSPTDNRTIQVSRGRAQEIVQRWKQHESWYNPTFYPIIEIASKSFHLPQLRSKRRVSVLLPHDYHLQKHKKYPVLYLQDGQNLFEDSAPYGTWGVDRQMARLAQEGRGDLIIVAIDHGGKSRIAEYSPVATRQFGEGLGKNYAHFLADTLKPFIDNKYRTLSDRTNTGIGGSSMGGLISLYAGLLYPHIFSKFMILSPSLWLTPGMFEAFKAGPVFADTKFFFFAGGKEPKSTIRQTHLLHTILLEKKVNNLSSALTINPDATHSEAFWGKIFPVGVKSLY
jgi:predicted alpha/beta superfamily hydrolase